MAETVPRGGTTHLVQAQSLHGEAGLAGGCEFPGRGGGDDKGRRHRVHDGRGRGDYGGHRGGRGRGRGEGWGGGGVGVGRWLGGLGAGVGLGGVLGRGALLGGGLGLLLEGQLIGVGGRGLGRLLVRGFALGVGFLLERGLVGRTSGARLDLVGSVEGE